jgi:hypothetical protein
VSEDEIKPTPRRALFDQLIASKPVGKSLLNETETASATAQRIWFGRCERGQIGPPTPAPPELQRQVFTDIACQLITCLTAAANDKADLTRSAVMLATCDRLLDVYSRAGFYQLTEFQHELRTNLLSAFRKARRSFFKQGSAARKSIHTICRRCAKPGDNASDRPRRTAPRLLRRNPRRPRHDASIRN